MNELNMKFLKMIHNDPYKTYRNEDRNICHIAITRDWSDFIQKGIDPKNIEKSKNDPEYNKYMLNTPVNDIWDIVFDPDSFFKVADYLMKNNEADCYFTINSFYKNVKNTEAIRHLNAIVLDYDFYKIEKYKNFSPYQMYEAYIKDTLPKKPSAVIDSGRGLYVLYIFNHCSYKRLNLYKAIYKAFYERQKQFGMDVNAMNGTQIIRLPGSFNSKSLSEVTILELNDTEYELNEFADLLPYTQEQVAEHKKKREIEKTNKTKILYSSDAIQRHRQRKVKKIIDDFRTLILMRNQSEIKEGYRETILYLTLEQMLWSGFKKEDAMETAKELNRLFLSPLKDKEIEQQCKPSKIWFHCTSKAKIINKLDITEDEMPKLQVLKSRDYKNKLHQKLKSRHPLLGKTFKEVDLLNRRNRVIELKKQGFSNKQIADKLGVSKSIVTQDMRYIREHLNEFKQKLTVVVESITTILNNKEFSNKLTFEEHRKLFRWLEIAPVGLEAT